MKFLITGGAGYIGSILSKDLLSNGHEVIVVDNFNYEQNSLAHICSEKKLKIIKSDFRDFSNYNSELKSSDFIIPLAGMVGAPMCNRNPHEAKSINLDNQIELFDKISGDQYILMPTTNSAYGTSAGKVCDEKSKLNPISTYAIHKVDVEKKLMEKKNWISFRLATVFGMSPRMRVDLLVNDFVFRAMYEKFIVLFEHSFNRNYIHVKDVSKAFLFAVNNLNSMNNNIFNVGLSDANLNKLELCERIKKYIKFKIIIDEVEKDPDQRNYIVSNDKIEGKGFKTDYSIDDGVEELIKGYSSFKFRKYSNI